jgi:hypothetical protein
VVRQIELMVCLMCTDSGDLSRCRGRFVSGDQS